MINDQTMFDKFNNYSLDHQMVITFENGDIITNLQLESESFELKESICSSGDIQYGSCEASEVRFTIHNTFVSHEGQTFTVQIIVDGDTDNPFMVGTYKALYDRASADKLKREIIGYDSMYDILNTDVASWYNTLYPTSSTTKTVAQIRKSFLDYFGISYDNVTLINDDIVVGKTISPTTLSGKDVITAICQLNACFGHIGRDNKFKFITLTEMIPGLYPAEDLYPADDLYPSEEQGSTEIAVGCYMSADYEDYTTALVDKVIIRQEDTDIGGIYGSGTNAFIIQGNFLAYGQSSADLNDMAQRIYNQISSIWYRPFEIEMIGNPVFEVGDGVRVSTTYEVVYSYILSRVLRGIQALRDSIVADGNETRNEQVNSVNTEIIQLKGKTAVITKNVDEVSARLTYELDDTEYGSYAYQTAEEIGLCVTKENVLTDLNNKIDQSKMTITSSGITIQSTGNFNVDTANLQITSSALTFKGNITSTATITGGTISGATIKSSSGSYSTTIESGMITTNYINLTDSGTNFSTVIVPGIITLSGGGGTVILSQGSVSATSVYALTSMYIGAVAVATVNDIPSVPSWLSSVTAMQGMSGTYGPYVRVTINGTNYALPTGEWVQNYVGSQLV